MGCEEKEIMRISWGLWQKDSEGIKMLLNRNDAG